MSLLVSARRGISAATASLEIVPGSIQISICQWTVLRFFLLPDTVHNLSQWSSAVSDVDGHDSVEPFLSSHDTDISHLSYVQCKLYRSLWAKIYHCICSLSALNRIQRRQVWHECKVLSLLDGHYHVTCSWYCLPKHHNIVVSHWENDSFILCETLCLCLNTYNTCAFVRNWYRFVSIGSHFWGAKGAPILFSEITFVWLHVHEYSAS